MNADDDDNDNDEDNDDDDDAAVDRNVISFCTGAFGSMNYIQETVNRSQIISDTKIDAF